MAEHIHINRGINRRWRGMVRRPGYQKWEPAGPWRKKKDTAAKDMLRKFLSGNFKRGHVWFISDYYDPVPVIQMHK
tara:strand:+ start:4122 stop:4349 length:228 start_codon:yes stop_codon:yes gene_type:complete